jgi:hypothetical protein
MPIAAPSNCTALFTLGRMDAVIIDDRQFMEATSLEFTG